MQECWNLRNRIDYDLPLIYLGTHQISCKQDFFAVDHLRFLCPTSWSSWANLFHSKCWVTLHTNLNYEVAPKTKILFLTLFLIKLQVILLQYIYHYIIDKNRNSRILLNFVRLCLYHASHKLLNLFRVLFRSKNMRLVLL